MLGVPNIPKAFAGSVGFRALGFRVAGSVEFIRTADSDHNCFCSSCLREGLWCMELWLQNVPLRVYSQMILCNNSRKSPVQACLGSKLLATRPGFPGHTSI